MKIGYAAIRFLDADIQLDKHDDTETYLVSTTRGLTLQTLVSKIRFSEFFQAIHHITKG
jgi:hypothetical protein